MKSKNHSIKLALAAGAIAAALVTTNAYAQQGMGIGNNNPQEMLDVSGAIKLGTTTTTNAGTIRWTGTEFQGWDGTQWITFGGGIATQLTEAQVEAFVTNGPIDLFAGTTLNGSPILTTEVDGSTTNEIQDLQLVGNILTITNNGTATQIDLSPYVNAAVTLDAAYDQGGAGLGREINATDGAVRINGDDGFLVTGTVGSGDAIEVSGAGTRMFFNPKKAAIRAGYVDGTQWDDANIGDYSTAMGGNTTASGNSSTAMGELTTASGYGSTAMGGNTTASGDGSTAMGVSTTASGYISTAIGAGTTASGFESIAMGAGTIASGLYSTAMGNATRAFGDESTAMGRSTIASGTFSIAMGRYTTAPSFNETAVGSYNTTYTPSSTTAWNAADRLFVIGNGTGTGVNSSNALTIYKDGKMNINDAYDMPTADGTAGQVMTTDGAGVVSFVDPETVVITAGTNVTITGTGTVGDPYVVSATSGTCGLSIGDTYQGGIIFYLDASGCHGLISAPSDQSSGIQWYNGSYTNTTAFASCVGCGDGNTSRIVYNQGAGAYAAKLCSDLNLGGKTDWYLPSKYELNLMYQNIGQGNALGLGNVGGFASSFYWSSTEVESFNAWIQLFLNGLQTNPSKDYAGYVRAIRAF